VSIDTVLAVLDHELARLTQELASADELRVAHDQERQFAAEQVSTAAALASAAGRIVLFYRDPRRLRENGPGSEVASMASVTAEDVRRVARRYLGKGARAVVVSVP
jgi:predicted Zn-dependent peptidase